MLNNCCIGWVRMSGARRSDIAAAALIPQDVEDRAAARPYRRRRIHPGANALWGKDSKCEKMSDDER